MVFAVLTAVTILIAVILVAGVTLRPLFSKPSAHAVALWDGIDAKHYRPMERLLREDDFRFLASTHSYSSRAIRRLRAERRKVFRGYLSFMAGDFARLCSAMTMLMVESHEPMPELASTLMRSRAMFAWLLIAVECRLMLHAVGLNGIAVDMRPLVNSLEAMRTQWQSMATLPTAA